MVEALHTTVVVLLTVTIDFPTLILELLCFFFIIKDGGLMSEMILNHEKLDTLSGYTRAY